MNDEQSLKEKAPQPQNSWVGGAILVLIGAAFLIANFSNLRLNNWWALFILIPLVTALVNAWRDYQMDGTLSARARNALLGSMAPTFVAVIFLFELDWGRVWPGFLILGGLALLLRSPER